MHAATPRRRYPWYSGPSLVSASTPALPGPARLTHRGPEQRRRHRQGRGVMLQPAQGAVVTVGGLFDAGWSLDDCPAPGYLLVPSDSRSALKSVIASASGKALSMVWSVGKGEQPEGRSLDACGAARVVSPPHPPAGFDVLALWPAAATEDPSTPSPTFVHSQPVEGMAYNASFAGGLLTGTVQVRYLSRANSRS